MSHPNRILALDPMTRGFGYVIFEEPFYLAEFGFARIKEDKKLGAMAYFEKLLTDFTPEAVVLEDTKAPGSRRHHRVRELIEALTAIARERGVQVFLIARTAVVARFSSGEARATKQMIAETLTRHFPELRLRLPKPRKMWESEHEHMSIFDALALAVTHVTK
jgi:Holliday junction resolvasome RuvABC endonuclease subunit